MWGSKKEEDVDVGHLGPLLVFVNSKSGGRQGATLLPKFRQILPADRVVDLIEDGPRAA